MIIFVDLAFLIIVIIMLGVGSVAAISNWVLTHLFMVCFVLILKSLLLNGRVFFQKERPGSYYILAALYFILDVIRTGAALWAIIMQMQYMMSGDIVLFAIGTIELLIVGAMILYFALLPMCPVYSHLDDSDDLADNLVLYIGMEVLSIVCILLVTYLFSWILLIILGIIVYFISTVLISI